MFDDDNKERRISKRYNSFWLVYKDNKLWGHLEDISEDGVKISLDLNLRKLDENKFYIDIYPPKDNSEIEIEKLTISVKLVWKKIDKNTNFITAGFKIVESNIIEKEKLNKIIEYFENNL